MSQNLRSSSPYSSTGLLPLDLAVDCPWVTLDGQKHRNVLVIDVDHPDAMTRWLAIPASVRPILVLDPWSGRAHAVVPLKLPVCVDPDARAEPKKLASFAGRLMAAALGGTLLPHRSCAKWPWGRRETVVGELIRRGPAPIHRQLYHDILQAGLCWHTEVGAGSLELRAIVEALDEQWRSSAAPPERSYGRNRGEPDARGRNCALFDMVRRWACDHVETDRGRILDRAREVNERFPDPLPSKEVASVAKSIAKFMVTKFKRGGGKGSLVHRGRDRHLTSSLSTRDAQAVAARRTNERRQLGTIAAIQAAAADLRASGGRLTQVALAHAAKVSTRTVRRYWTHLYGVGLATPCRGVSESGQRVVLQVLALIQAGGMRANDLRPESDRPSLAEEAQASRHRHAVIASEVRYYKRRTASLSKRGARVTRLTFVRWPRIVDAAVATEWKLAEAALADAWRRGSKRKQRAKGEATKARLAWMARHLGPSVRDTKWATELSRLDHEWEGKQAALERRSDGGTIRLSRLRSLARVRSPGLSEQDLDRLGADYTAMVGDLTRRIDLAMFRTYRTWAICNRHRFWRRALRDAGHQ